MRSEMRWMRWDRDKEGAKTERKCKIEIERKCGIEVQKQKCRNADMTKLTKMRHWSRN